jgi:hypothetical protein
MYISICPHSTYNCAGDCNDSNQGSRPPPFVIPIDSNPIPFLHALAPGHRGQRHEIEHQHHLDVTGRVATTITVGRRKRNARAALSASSSPELDHPPVTAAGSEFLRFLLRGVCRYGWPLRRGADW